MANYEMIAYEQAEDKIFRLTLNRPEKLNAMSQKLLRELDGALDEFENNAAASVLIIRGAGRAFCAGYDLQPTQQTGSGFTVTSDRIGLAKNGGSLAAIVVVAQTSYRAGSRLLFGGRN